MSTQLRTLETAFGDITITAFCGPAYLGDRRCLQVGDDVRLEVIDAAYLAVELLTWLGSLDNPPRGFQHKPGTAWDHLRQLAKAHLDLVEPTSTGEDDG